MLDALRPQRVQQGIWAEIAGTPASKYFADPQQGSIHSYGMAVDITLLDSQGRKCDMGSGFDEMHPRSHPALDAEHLALGVLRTEQLIERGWLLAAMSRGGFGAYPQNDGISTMASATWCGASFRASNDGQASTARSCSSRTPTNSSTVSIACCPRSS